VSRAVGRIRAVRFVRAGRAIEGVAREVQGGLVEWIHWNADAFHVAFPTIRPNATSTDVVFIRADQVIKMGPSTGAFIPVGDQLVASGHCPAPRATASAGVTANTLRRSARARGDMIVP